MATVPVLLAVLVSAAPGQAEVEQPGPQHHLAGRVVDGEGLAVEQAPVALHALTGDGTRGLTLTDAVTASSGWYGFDIAPGCYLVEVVAPEGASLLGGGTVHREVLCLAAGRSGTGEDPSDDDSGNDDGSNDDDERDGDDDIDRAGPAITILDDVVMETWLSSGQGQGATALSAVEWELIRLTNELRADPAGPLAREAPLPDCVDDDYFQLAIDPASGRPEPVAPLLIDPASSEVVSRPWAARMASTGELEHRSSRSQVTGYRAMGLSVDSWGENIAWAVNYDPADVAWIHFTGWRESDDLHYCTLLTNRFTHLAVGEIRDGANSWAAQNFYRLD
jgi:hypothetical protein